MSLSGLESLISLEGARLESARQTSSNFQSVGSTIQQQGVATAQSKSSLVLQKIDGEYTKACAEADVRRLESKLVRERKAEKLALATAAIVTGVSAMSNLWDAGKDLFGGAQKVGQIPDYMKSPNISVDKNTINKPGGASFSQSLTDGSSGGIGYVSGPGKGTESGEKAETVYAYQFAGNGSTSNFRAATITDYDKMRVLGPEFAKMKAENGGKVPTFAQIQQQNPRLAEKLMADKTHDMSSDEATDFMDVFQQVAPLSSTMNYDTIDPSSGSSDGDKMAALSNMVNGTPSPGAQAGEQLAAVSGVTSQPVDVNTKPLTAISPAQAAQRLSATKDLITDADLKGTGYKSVKDLTDDANSTDPIKAKKAQSALGTAVQSKMDETQKRINSNSASFVATKNQDNPPTESLQLSTKGGYLFAPKVTPEDKRIAAKSLGMSDADAEKFSKMSITEIYNGKDGLKNINGLMKNLQAQDEGNKIHTEKLTTDSMVGLLGEDRKAEVEKFNGQTVDEISASNPNLAAELSQKMFSGDAKVPANLKMEPPKVHMITEAQGVNQVQGIRSMDNAVPYLRDGLKAAGKDKQVNGLGDYAKAAMSVLVNTVQAAMPYFQAYLSAKDKADNTQEELKAAMDKLAAANRKLNALEMQIDAFGGRGA